VIAKKLIEIINKSFLEITKGSVSNDPLELCENEIHNGESKIIDKDGYLFYTYGGINYLLGYTGDENELVLPEDYNGEKYEIYNYAFYEGTNLTSITISNNVTGIGSNAFKG
jgi:hypothetical protein